ncbi:hypothetical protein [Paenibacillus montanisoli]|uniref:Uncharacterized protein n=1 Tax=Paenibacillus montanisoli TaxID=2081970 RepID=A0A328TZ78_9BACL|nr:hypothetical protein [Paenibacillus montanisoli]RAP75837.1 hypothetical protein DL346_10380 [Paenibacillus montanisoli]
MSDVRMKLLEELMANQREIANGMRNVHILAKLKENMLPEQQPARPAAGPSLNAELFLAVTDVYYHEEEERIRLGNAKKSGRRVNVELTSMISAFFSKHLDDTFQAERETDGFVYVFKEGKAVCAIRFITDMGFIRGDAWYKIADELVSKLRYGLKHDQVFFIVSTLRNGLDQTHVQRYLGKDIGSNWQFMNDRHAVMTYLAKVQAHTSCLAEPGKQLLFMASELHPNILADDLHKMTPEMREEKRKEVQRYNWIHRIEPIMDQINRM